MNQPQFKKRILLETGVFTGVLLVLCGFLYFLMYMNDDYTDSNNTARRRVDEIDAELNGLQRKYVFISQNAVLYKEVQKKQNEGRLGIKRPMIFETFNQFRNEFELANLKLSASPIQESKDPKYKRPTSVVSSSEVSFDCETLLDENIFRLLKAMQERLSGVAVISKVSINLVKPLDIEILREVSTKGTYPLFKASVKFNWYSIDPVEVSETPGQPPKP